MLQKKHLKKYLEELLLYYDNKSLAYLLNVNYWSIDQLRKGKFPRKLDYIDLSIRIVYYYGLNNISITTLLDKN